MTLDELEALGGRTLPAVSDDHRPALAFVLGGMPVSRHLGVQVVGTADGVSVMALPVTERVTFDGRSVMGGIVGTLADMAAVSAVVAALPDGASASTTGFHVEVLAPATGGALIAIGRVVEAGERRGTGRADVYAAGGGASRLIATCLASARVRMPG